MMLYYVGYSSAKARTSVKHEVMIDTEVVCNVGRGRYLLDTALNNEYSISRDFYYSVKNLPVTYSQQAYINFIRRWGTVSNIYFVAISLSVTISAFFRIAFWPAWLSPRMRLSSPDHAPLIARTRVLAICSFCRFSSYNTASGRFYQPGETFMTHLTYS